MLKLYERKKFLKGKRKKVILLCFLLLFTRFVGNENSYSVFKYIIKSNSNLKLITGNVCVNFDKEFKKGINIQGLNPGKSKEDVIKIQNNGSLKASIKLKFFKEEKNLNKEFLSNFNYRIVLKNNEKASKELKGNLYDLMLKEDYIDIKDENENYIILNPKEEITLCFNLCLDKNINYKYYNKGFDFFLDIIASQINDNI